MQTPDMPLGSIIETETVRGEETPRTEENQLPPFQEGEVLYENGEAAQGVDTKETDNFVTTDMVRSIDRANLPEAVKFVLDTVERREGMRFLLIPEGGNINANDQEPVLSVQGVNGSSIYFVSLRGKMLTFDATGTIHYGARGSFRPEGNFKPNDVCPDPEAPILTIGEAIDYLREKGIFSPVNNSR